MTLNTTASCNTVVSNLRTKHWLCIQESSLTPLVSIGIAQEQIDQAIF